jgi:hypothetical protein
MPFVGARFIAPHHGGLINPGAIYRGAMNQGVMNAVPTTMTTEETLTSKKEQL